MRRIDCHSRIKDTRNSYTTAFQTASAFIRIAEEQPHLLHDYELDLTTIRAMAGELHDVYFVRMFACFESSIRHYWWARIKRTRPSTEQLLSSIAGRFNIPRDTLDVVHEIRDFRNSLIHEQHHVNARFSIDEASKALNAYLSRLPLQW